MNVYVAVSVCGRCTRRRCVCVQKGDNFSFFFLGGSSIGCVVEVPELTNVGFVRVCEFVLSIGLIRLFRLQGRSCEANATHAFEFISCD